MEILEDEPDTAAVIASIGGGGLVVGVASAIKALKPNVKVWGAEPETAAPVALSFKMGSPQAFTDWKPSFVDGAGGQSVFPRMWQRIKPLVDGCIVVSLEETRRAMRLMAENARIISEGAGALPLAAALTGNAGQGPVVAIVSGGPLTGLRRPSRAIDRALDQHEELVCREPYCGLWLGRAAEWQVARIKARQGHADRGS